MASLQGSRVFHRISSDELVELKRTIFVRTFPPDPLILYSTNTWLSYMISQRYYRQEHYVWCSPYFNTLTVASSELTVPPSSSPGNLYKLFFNDVFSGEQHSERIKRNKVGLRRGANCKEATGVITEQRKLEIYAIVSRAQIIDFRPVIYVIPYASAHHLVVEVPVKERSHPLSLECRIEQLPRSLFDVIDIYGGRNQL